MKCFLLFCKEYIGIEWGGYYSSGFGLHQYLFGCLVPLMLTSKLLILSSWLIVNVKLMAKLRIESFRIKMLPTCQNWHFESINS